MAKASFVQCILVGTAAGAVLLASPAWAQAGGKAATTASAKADTASAYYHYTLAHMYADQAGLYGNRGDYVNRAIENYKEAIKADPSSPVLSEELSELYIQSGRLREAIADAEDTLKQNPNDLGAHRLLARVFTRQIGDSRSGKIDENNLHRALDQYQIITNLAPMDVDAWLMLARLQKASDNSVEAEKAYQKLLAIDPDNEDGLMGLALVYSDLGEAQKAAQTLKTLVDKNPSSRSLLTLAAAYEEMKDYKSAALMLRKALELNPPNEKEVRRTLAQDLVLARDYTGALEVYRQLAEADPADAQALLRMAQIYLQERDFTKAREFYDKAKGADATSIEIRNFEVSLLMAEDRFPDAIDRLKEILASTAKRNYNENERLNRVELLERLAGLHRAMDQTEPAVDAYRQIAELNPMAGAAVAADVIETYRSGKEYAKAQQEADADVKKWPDDRDVRVARDQVLAEMGRVDESAADLRKLLNPANAPKDNTADKDEDQSSDNYKTYLNLADVYDKGQRFADMGKALDQAEKLAKSDPERINVWFQRGAMYERMKNRDMAEKEFRKVLEADPDNAGALNYLGYMLADANVRLNESLDLITKALDRDPGNGAYLDSLGWAQFRLGRLDDAEQNLRRALQKTPRDPTVHDHMAEVLMKQSKVKEAVAQWEASLREWGASSPADLRPEEVSQVKAKLEAAKSRLAKQ